MKLRQVFLHVIPPILTKGKPSLLATNKDGWVTWKIHMDRQPYLHQSCPYQYQYLRHYHSESHKCNRKPTDPKRHSKLLVKKVTKTAFILNPSTSTTQPGL